ncbi:hypothetical protein [Hymenobacter lapidiphilus]|uniref:DUF4255 domain-containing protein n=1 Tax=Hymenobacter lapidiphilus TaxID=2608003 RepID=A0A7Y7U6V8_9BACT|nr:hypothetical protein [Hymenobacter lapidiphilus]NVO33211.1 hypothetical protein [Hymenobacter lapidiphilus]
MNEALAALYARRLTQPTQGEPLPFLDRVVGLTRTYQTRVPNGPDGETRAVFFPVPVAFTAAECEADPRYLVPDQHSASILWFEDGGTVPVLEAANVQGWISTLRLKLWLNPERLQGALDMPAILNALDRAMQLRYQSHAPPFTNLRATYAQLPGGPEVVSAYSYETPMVYPPYALLHLEIKTRFLLAASCYNAPLPTLKPLDACLTY